MLQSLRSSASPSPEAELASVAKARSRRPKAVMVGLLVLALCSGGLLLRFGPWSNRQRDLNPYTTKAERGVLSGVITASGELQAQQKVNVSPRKQGQLAELKVNEGDVVEKEEVLAVMNRGDLDDRIEEKQALLRQAEANFQNKREDFERRSQLYASGAISADDFSDARFEMMAGQAGLVAARERVEQLEQESREQTIRAPFSGTITARYAEPGSFVTPTTAASATAGATSASIVELSQGLEVRARVPESDIGRIEPGQTAEIRVDAYPDERFQAKVSEVAPRAAKENSVTSFEVKLNFVNPQNKLKIGMTADINFQTGRSAPRILVPTVAITLVNGQQGVLLVDENLQPRFQPVELGNSSGDKTAILNGLESGTSVFIDLPPWADRRD